jgi:predicted DNA-binding protein (MmcQ/YjbR family)
MELDALRQYLLAKPATTEEIPFGPQALVYKVAGKMFALIAWDEEPMRISLKCDPERALALREVFHGVRGAYHFNKRHWNMVDLDGSVPDGEVLAMVDLSFDLVVGGLPRARRDEIRGISSSPS